MEGGKKGRDFCVIQHKLSYQDPSFLQRGIVSCQPCIQLQQNNTKTVHVCFRSQFSVPEELWSHVGHRSHDNLGLCAVGGLLARFSVTLSRKTKVRELWNEVGVEKNIGTVCVCVCEGDGEGVCEGVCV